MSKNDHPQTAEGFDRRKFLTRVAVAGGVAYTVPVVTTIGLSRATATPCAGVAAAASQPQLTADATAQQNARSVNTHSPCYKACMERRANQQYEADTAFFAATEAAGDNDALLMDSARQYRMKLAKLDRDFRTCTRSCT